MVAVHKQDINVFEKNVVVNTMRYIVVVQKQEIPMICMYKHVRAYDCATMKYDGCIPFNTMSNARTPNFRI